MGYSVFALGETVPSLYLSLLVHWPSRGSGVPRRRGTVSALGGVKLG